MKGDHDTVKGDDVVRDLFGAILADQGRGFYVGLELMALVRGTLDQDDAILPAPTGEPLEIRRRSHDFARRLMGEPPSLGEGEAPSIQGERALEVLAALGRGLRVPVPGRRRRMPWHAEHFQPFVGELIHYDAVFRTARVRDPEEDVLEIGSEKKRVSTERYLYRGAGGLAHAILRSDPDSDRLAGTRDGFRRLVSDSGTPLGELFGALSKKDKGVDAAGSFKDDRESMSVGRFDRDSDWVEVLRDGVHRIVQRSLPTAKVAEALLHWVPYCVARYQADVSFRSLDRPSPSLPVDLGSSASPIRRKSREMHERCRADIVHAIDSRAEQLNPALMTRGKSKSWRDSARGFFSGTLASVGALNATTGKRHFVLRDELLESIVLAQIDEEVPFDRFCREVLFERLGLVVDLVSAGRCNDLARLNRSDFEGNSEILAGRLETLGMLVKYSDATRMVHAEVGR